MTNLKCPCCKESIETYFLHECLKIKKHIYIYDSHVVVADFNEYLSLYFLKNTIIISYRKHYREIEQDNSDCYFRNVFEHNQKNIETAINALVKFSENLEFI